VKHELLKAHGALLAVALIYGLNYLLAKDVMQGFLDPREFILIRAIGATGLFWLFASFTSKGETKIERGDLGRMALAGLFGVAANQMFFFEGLNLTTPINASIIMTINPVLVLLLSAIILKDPLSPLKIIGIAVGATGAILLISQGGSAN
jgi:drug/metabolite transporter (DMT)-like permease